MAKQITSLGLILLRKVKNVQVVRAPRLRLSSEDNSTLTGTAAILEQFGKDQSLAFIITMPPLTRTTRNLTSIPPECNTNL